MVRPRADRRLDRLRRRGERGRVVPAHATARVWTTDKDGIILGLLACGDPGGHGQTPGERYSRADRPLRRARLRAHRRRRTPEQKAKLGKLSPDDVTATELAGDPITPALTKAPGNGAPIGGLKVVTENGWFAARPSGTEDVYKVYAESFKGPEHLARIQEEARDVVAAALNG